MKFDTLIDMLSSQAKEHPDRVVFTFDAGVTGVPSETITYEELAIRARAIAARIQQLGGDGKSTLLIFDCGIDFIASFFGCIYSGAIPVPLYPPFSTKQLERLRSIIQNCRASLALVTSGLLNSVREIDEYFPKTSTIQWVEVNSVERSLAYQWQDPHMMKDSPALLQYTSGSTGIPKGVVLSHDNLLSNFRMISEAMNANEMDIMVSWLPMYHDMGLIGAILHSVYSGMQTVFMPPASVVRPLRWLSAISKYRGTVTVAPNFAYNLCTQKIKTADVLKLDLSSLRVAFNGAEPIQATTLTNFHQHFKSAKLRDDIFLPCYGLAEASLIVSGRDMSRPIKKKQVDLAALADHKVIETESPVASKIFVGCGQRCSGVKIRIVDNATHEDCAPGNVGEIWIAGPSVATGYLNYPEATQEHFIHDHDDLYLRSGDLGFLDHEGELYVTGRIKDLIIIRGKNYAPQDLEFIAQSAHPLIQEHTSAAFSIDSESGDECVILLQEIKPSIPEKTRHEVGTAISQEINREEAIQIGEIVFILPNSIARTSSGKIRRSEMRRRYHQNELSKLD